jgi:ATP adenylyltransferase
VEELVLRQLWAPWRLVYIQGADEQRGCVFCRAAEGVEDDFVVRRGDLAFALLNRFPYASGHLMVAPYRHEADFGALTAEEALEIHRLVVAALAALGEAMHPHGFNLGWNLGRVAGAGIVEHVHMHVVPRWGGDTNFMPVLSDVKVIPETLGDTREKLARAWR